MDTVFCPGCDRKYAFKPEFEGRKVKCVKCGTAFLMLPSVPEAPAAPTSDALFPGPALSAIAVSDNGLPNIDVTPEPVREMGSADSSRPDVAWRYWLLGGAVLFLAVLGLGCFFPTLGLYGSVGLGLCGLGMSLYGGVKFFLGLSPKVRLIFFFGLFLRLFGISLFYFDSSVWNPKTKRGLLFVLTGLGVMMAVYLPMSYFQDRMPAAAGGQVAREVSDNPRNPRNAGMRSNADPVKQDPRPAFRKREPLPEPIDDIPKAIAALISDDPARSQQGATFLYHDSRGAKRGDERASQVAEAILERRERGWLAKDPHWTNLLYFWVTVEQIERIERLIDRLDDDELQPIYSCLMKLNTREAAEALMHQVEPADGQHSQRESNRSLQAVITLCEMSAAEPFLLELTRHSRNSTPVRVLRALAKHGTAASLERLEELSQHDDVPTQMAATQALREVRKRLEKK